jgi:DNA-binding transcriptional LysR family regulator
MQRNVAINRQRFDWDAARVLLAVLRSPSLSAAARSLGLDKSTVSRRIEALERALRARLFVRTREGLRPTAAGERLRVHAERIEAEMQSLASAAIAGLDEVSGNVRIATTEALGPRLIQGGLLDLRAQYPGLSIEVLAGNRPLDLSRGEAELAIRVSPTRDPSLTVRVLGKYPISLFAAPSYLRTRGHPRALAQLAGHDALLPSGELESLPEAIWLRERSGTRIVFRSSSLPTLVEAAVRGHGIVALTHAWGTSVSGLEHVVGLDMLPARPTWLVFHPDVIQQPAVRLVADRIALAFAASR